MFINFRYANIGMSIAWERRKVRSATLITGDPISYRIDLKPIIFCCFHVVLTSHVRNY